MRDIEQLLVRLSRSHFRSRFRLAQKEAAYLERKGLDVVLGHAREMLRRRLAPAAPANDGRQTPWRGHPLFVAQHATATCCRSCLFKWHGIEKGRELTEAELDYVVAIITRWLDANRPHRDDITTQQLPLFDSEDVGWAE